MPTDRDDEPDWGRTEWAPDDADDEDEWAEDDSDFAEPETRACPECGADVFAELDHCPACGHWWVEASPPLDGKPLWYLVLGALGVLAVIMLYSGLMHWL